jgi:colanic acid biosynthesis glycosyl transferase WcaI
LRLLILSIRYAPEFTSNAIVITGLAKQLAARGHQVTVLAGTPHHQLPRVPPGYAARLFRGEMIEGVRVIRCWAYPRSVGKLAKVWNYGSFTVSSLLGGLFAGRADVILVVSPPFWLGMNALLLGGLRRCPVIYNAQDLFPDAYLASREVRLGPFTRIMGGLMNAVYRRVDRITVITDSFANAIATRGIDPGKIVTIPNFVDTTLVRPMPRMNSFRQQYGLGERFVAMYAGNIGYTHGTELLVEAAEKLAAIPDLHFVVIGGGSKQADLAELARSRGITNMQFLPTQPREVLAEMLAGADVFVMTSKPGVGSTSFPGRIYNCLLAARPVLASVDENSDLAEVLPLSGAGIVTVPGDVENFCRELTRLYHDESLRQSMGLAGSDYMARCYSAESVVEKYEGLFQELAARERRNP